MLWRAANATVHLGLPYASLEFENPLAGTETVLSHPVLEWRDADYRAGVPPWYDDWTVSHPGAIDGDANEIWLRANGHSAWTSTTVPSTTISIHLNGDGNDGRADVLVDGLPVAQLDMFTWTCCQTALILVRGLPATTHTITVNAVGAGQGGGVDVAILGAAALSDVFKWQQPPEAITLGNVFNGWNEPLATNFPPLVADDWVCTSRNPVTKIRWWGSFLDWTETQPPQLPAAFQITMWTDVPADPAQPGSFSHPGVAIWQTHCQSFTATFVGWDYDPRIGSYEACFLFEQDLAEQEWFYQDPGPSGTNIYWISIAAEYGPENPELYVWGWKTRPRDRTSPAPDDAVRIHAPPPWLIVPGTAYEAGEPIFWPDPEHSWDMTFELISSYTSGGAKWEQWPDLSPAGMDVKDCTWPEPPVLLADDFQCTASGPITNITIWGSYLNDVVPLNGSNVVFTLSIHADIPAAQSPTGYSMPGALLWMRQFGPGSFAVRRMAEGLDEGWFLPPEWYDPHGDTVCFQYDFPIPMGEAFQQTGLPGRPEVFWLDCQVQVVPGPGAEEAQFGWKTCVTNWNDVAVWVNGLEPYQFPQQPPWNRLMSMSQRPLDLAFRINSGAQGVNETKWSQPPVLATDVTNNFNGWNEVSIHGDEQIVADDWVCTDARPISDIHWWGSFRGWLYPVLPEASMVMPSAFVFAIWTDVPAEPNGGWSHPGQVLWQFTATNYAAHFAGWDWDPRSPGNPPEACFKFHVDIPREQWFYQDPVQGRNVYWLSIAAQYPPGGLTPMPWGWKTRPRDLSSPAPDDAVTISAPTAPGIGERFQQGQPIEFPPGISWDMAFELTAGPEAPLVDFGDAPDGMAAAGYPTLLANNGARHPIVPGVFLGRVVDGEADGQPNGTATGDDTNPPTGPDDEDGVVLFGSHMIPGGLTGVAVTASTNGYLSAWVDFNVDGSWAPAGDQIFSNVWVTAGSTNLYFMVPFSVPQATNTFARFRFSTAPITNFTGLAVDGEVEDYQWWTEPLDFGDAPEPYPTKYAAGGACHWLMQGVFLGAVVDAEADGQPNASATGDDLANLADEDGVTLMTPLVPGQMATVQVVASLAGAFLNAWVDFGGDGSWASLGDQIIVNASPVAGPNLYNFPVPASAVPGSKVFARFRFSTAMGLTFTNLPGVVPNGEVEDHQWQIAELDFGDAPDPTYPTLLANNGARHVVGPLFLGARVDAEPDGQPNAAATGDDLNPPVGLDDEDGVLFHAALMGGVPNTITVTTSLGGYLQAWLDVNGDGDWADPGEQVITDKLLGGGANAVNFFVPALPAGMTKTYMRFRLSSSRGLGFTGLATDGEVEDYAVTIQPLKWLQRPELGWEGVDVDNFWVQLADDFQCTQTGPITDIHLWGSFVGDVLPPGGPGSMTITLYLYSDVPAGFDSTNSHPGRLLWSKVFTNGQYTAGHVFTQSDWEWWHDPATALWQRFGDTNIYQFDFYIDPAEAFSQVEGTIYWLGVKYTPGANDRFTFGWKTTYEPWNDDACWLDNSGPAPMWRPMVYGDGHPWAQLKPPANSINLAFAVSGQAGEVLDFGDAPDPTYPTLLANNGARHTIVPGLMLGHVVDAEANGQPDPGALGDDNNPAPGPDDEDGVVMPVLVPGQQATATVTVTGQGLLNAWIDFGGDGSWATPGDQVFTNVTLAAGTHVLPLTVPTTAPWGTTTFARFRFSTAANLGPTGAAPDGEVEDHVVYIHPLPVPDLGDAPDSSNSAGANMTAYPKGGPPGTLASYPTVYGGLGGAPPFGPLHMNPAGAAILGAAFSGEMEADVLADQDFVNNLNPPADSPDQDGADDGLVGPVILPHCGPGMINVAFSWLGLPPWPQMLLNVWCDWNRDGDWNDVLVCPDGTRVPEWAGQNIMVPPGVLAMPITFLCWHPSLQKQPIWIRITVSELAAPGPLGSFSGLAGGDGPPPGFQFGETEDYYITEYEDQQAFDFGDAPSTYPVLLANNGARHLVVPNFNLGVQVDAEADGLPHALALGDDLNNAADEDGVRFVQPILVNSQACVNVNLTGPIGGKLDAWVDFNGNGRWDAAEQVFASTALVAGVNPGLCFGVPLTAKLGTNFARFRLSSLGGLSPTGAAQDGEVEDYQILIRQRRPSTNIIFTWITVTNTPSSNQIVTVYWNAETNIHYEVLAAPNLGTNHGTDIVWQVVSPIIIGPTNRFTETNSFSAGQRYYRVRAPWTYP